MFLFKIVVAKIAIKTEYFDKCLENIQNVEKYF